MVIGTDVAGVREVSGRLVGCPNSSKVGASRDRRKSDTTAEIRKSDGRKTKRLPAPLLKSSQEC
jgi:hypothetical protein